MKTTQSHYIRTFNSLTGTLFITNELKGWTKWTSLGLPAMNTGCALLIGDSVISIYGGQRDRDVCKEQQIEVIER